MSDTEAVVSERRRISKIWIVPIIAVLLGAWMVYFTWSNQGPEITIVFKTAEPHHRTYGFPYPAVGPGDLPTRRKIRWHDQPVALQRGVRQPLV